MSLDGEFRLGFLPLTDAAPLIVADRLGQFGERGLKVVLERQGSWATARDKLAAGLLDGAHMLASVLLATRLGVGGVRADLIAPMALNVNGAAVTLSRRVLERLGTESSDAKALARLIASAPPGTPPLGLGIVFPYSLHAYLLRDWLTGGGIDAQRDVRLVVLPPHAMTERMRAGELDGFCAGAPWNAVAEAQGLGRTVAHAGRIDPGAPDKVFAVREGWAAQNREALAALLGALRRAARWADDPANRTELIGMLSAPDAVDVAPDSIARALDTADGAERISFRPNGAGRPDAGHVQHVLSQMRRARQIGGDVDEAALARIYRPDLFDAAQT